MAKICIIPKISGIGGMASFQAKFTAGLTRHGIGVCQDLKDYPYSAVLVIGGTRDLPGLIRVRRRGVPIIQRLDGMNWVHRNRRTGLRHFLRAEYGNWLLSFIRSRLADGIVYQSDFAREWWEGVHGVTPVPSTVIHNGVDLAIYSPRGAHKRPKERFRVLLVEGSLMGGYEIGLETAITLVDRLNASYSHMLKKQVELMVVGRVAKQVRDRWEAHSKSLILWRGLVPPKGIPKIDRSAHILYSADINAACPNSVIEALACGLPVVAFATGALPELVNGEAGVLVPYGGDPWRLDPPNIPGLSKACVEILLHQESFRSSARSRAEDTFSLDRMVESYINELLP